MKNTVWNNLVIVLFVAFVMSGIFGNAQNAAQAAKQAAFLGKTSSILSY